MAGGDASADASRRAGSARDAASSSCPPKPIWRWHPSRGRPDERDDDPRWLARRKHFFILSDAGKPVWSRYGDAANLSGFAAAISAMLASANEQLVRPVDANERSGGDDVAEARANERVVSFALDGMKNGADAKTARARRVVVVCLQRNGLTYVALSRVAGESVPVLLRQLRLLRHQTLFVLTSAVERALLRSGSKFDPRRLLRDESGGADAALGALAHQCTWDPGAFLGAWAPLPFSSTKRAFVHGALRRALSNAHATRSDRGRPRARAPRARLFAAVLATATHVVAVAAAPRDEAPRTTDATHDPHASLPVHPDDVYLLTHFARHVGAFRANDETFAPVCLPRRDPSGFAHAHVSFLRRGGAASGAETFLVLVADEGGPDAFHAVRRCKEDIEKTLRAAMHSGGASALDAIEARAAPVPTPGPGPRPGVDARGSVRLDGEVPRAAGGGAADRLVLHFLYARPPLGQYVAPEWAAPLDARDARKKTLRAYRRAAARLGAAADGDAGANGDASAARRGGGGGGGGGM